MGEKYDCYDDGPRLNLNVQPSARMRVRSPVGEGFPPPRYGEMLAGGEPAKSALSAYADRPSDTVKAAAATATQLLRDAAGGDPATQLSAGQQVVSGLGQCLTDMQKQATQTNTTYEMLQDRGSIPDRDIAEIARGSARRLKQTATDQMGILEGLVNTVLTTAEDSAVGAVGAQVEAAVNGIEQFAHTNTARLYNAMRRRGMLDVPEATDPAA